MRTRNCVEDKKIHFALQVRERIQIINETNLCKTRGFVNIYK